MARRSDVGELASLAITGAVVVVGVNLAVKGTFGADAQDAAGKIVGALPPRVATWLGLAPPPASGASPGPIPPAAGWPSSGWIPQPRGPSGSGWGTIDPGNRPVPV